MVPLKKGEDGDEDLYNTLYRSLQKPVRRRLLFSLLDHNPQEALFVPEGVHIGKKDIDRLNLELVHHHLPLLEEAGLIRWDREGRKIHKGPQFATVRKLIEAIQENDPLQTGD